jgi:hypothetical protein
LAGIGEPSWLRDEAFESTADRAKSLRDVFERCRREGGLRFDIDMTAYPLIRLM